MIRTSLSVLLPIFGAAIISVAPFGFLRLPTPLSLGRIISVSVALMGLGSGSSLILCVYVHPRGFENRSGIFPPPPRTPFSLRSSPGSLVTGHVQFQSRIPYALPLIHVARHVPYIHLDDIGAYLSPCLVICPLYIPYRNLNQDVPLTAALCRT